jgi:hypothetical protein
MDTIQVSSFDLRNIKMEIKAKLLPARDESTKKLFNLSVSKLKVFEDCQAKYKFCYIDKLPRKDQEFHIFGKFLHLILEDFHGKIIKNPELADTWEDVLKDSWDVGYSKYSSDLTGEQYKDAKDIVNIYKKVLIKEGLPNVIAVEEPFLININDQVLLNGVIDRIQIDKDGIIHVGDYKTTKDKKYLKDFFQLITYSFVVMLKDPSVMKLRSSFILLKHNCEYLTKEYSRDEVMSIAEKFFECFLKIGEEKLWRENPQFLCKYCDYLDNCKKGKDYLIKKGILKTKDIKKVPFVGIRKW